MLAVACAANNRSAWTDSNGYSYWTDKNGVVHDDRSACRRNKEINEGFETARSMLTDATDRESNEASIKLVMISLVIKGSGDFEDVKVLSSSLKSDEALAKVVNIVSKVKMKPVDCGDFTVPRYPLRFVYK
ncbi:hypothetical protein CJD38_14835 [Stenotrophobium rhamnosiphilum]|uniref:TonB C-terminal domain-containing protein n=2 Tax=Stenotrophobium rhamnosiphilum TaxID=2029166 RepID=A0A2T5MCD5_9GAMM|nr:hypothetical protein CJD38_14835 [Stenotrophobium rhamnosiphilum]